MLKHGILWVHTSFWDTLLIKFGCFGDCLKFCSADHFEPYPWPLGLAARPSVERWIYSNAMHKKIQTASNSIKQTFVKDHESNDIKNLFVDDWLLEMGMLSSLVECKLQRLYNRLARMRQGTRMQPHARGAMRDAPMAADHSRSCLGIAIWSISLWAETD